MKNFTNNFKQFTSRLSARWLIMALMMLVGTSSAWAMDKVIYITTGTSTGYSNPYIYVWNNSSNNVWPGEAMESAGKTSEGYPVYKYVWTSTINTFIVMDGNCGDNCKKTGDVSYSQTQNYIYNVKTGKWSSYNPCTTTTITWNNFTENMCLGDQQTLTATASSGAAVTFSSSNTTYASISGTTLTAAKAGSATITASVAASGNYCSATANKTVTISNCIPVGTVLYLKPSSSQWASANARYALYLFKDGVSSTWVDAEPVCNNDGYYQAVVPSGVYDELIWCRMNPATTENNWNNKWNQTGDLTYDSSKNLFTVASTNDWNGATTTWSKWTPEPCCTIVAKPTIQLASSPVKCGVDVTAGLITIDDYDDSKYTYTLNKDGNATTIVYNNGYAITEKGSYTVTADVSENSCGAQTSDPQEVTVTDNTHTINSFTVTPASDNVCEGSSVTLTATDVSGASYAWYKGTSETPINGATSYTYSPIITENTTFKVVVTKTKNECPATAEATSTIQVIELPAAPTLSSNTDEVCSGKEFTLPGDYNWYEVSTGGTKLNSATISGGITSNKSYWAEAKNASGCVSSTRTEYTVNVDEKPVIKLKAGPTICSGTEVTFASYVDASSIGDITWHTKSDFSDAAITSATPSQTTTYYVKATNGVCDPVTSSLKVTVSEKPKLTLKAAPTICNGATIAFPDYVDNNNTIGTVSWYLDEDRTQSAGVTAKPSQTTTYYAKAVNSPCAAATAQLAVTVNDKPAVPTLSADKTSLVSPDKATLTAGNTTNGLTYTLYNGETAGESQTSTGGNLTFNKVGEAGNYTVRVSKSCGTSTSDVVTITVCTPETNEFKHANSSYTQLVNQPTYYPGDKAYFVSTIDCCLTGTWSNNLQKGEEGWWTGLTGKTPKFSMTLTRAGNFTITNMANNGCTQDKNVLVNLDFTVTALSQVTNANGTASGADIALTWKHSANHTKVMVVRYPTAGTETIPAGGQSYSEGNTLGEGTVVYVGTSESYTDKNLPSGESYKYYFYTVNNNYYSDGVVLNMSSCPTPAKPQLESTAVTTCNGNVTTFGSITIANMEDYGNDYTFNLSNSAPTPDANGNIVINSAANTEYTVTVTNSCGNSNSTEVEIAINDKTPTITASAAVTQPNVALTLNSAAGDDTEWEVYTNPNEAGSINKSTGASVNFIATEIGEYVVKATNGDCSFNFTINVADAFYIWVRNAKEGETAYENFYHKDQNTEDVRGGEMFYAECEKMPTNGNTSQPEYYVNYNKGGREADLVNTDCEGYTWYGFKASDEVIAGTKYFYVHATNDINNKGFFTHTVPTKKALTADVYYKLCETSAEECGQAEDGWKIVEASAPYAGPMVHASGSTALGTDKFAALYVTDCSGKEIESYQWYKGDDVYSSSCNYVTKDGTVPGDAGQTNNIRPTVAGNYSCKVTYKDGSSITSAAVPVTGTYSNSFTSNIPVIVVNTNGVGFPDCANSDKGHTPSAQTDYYKAKRSVDVKIYDGTSVIYDRKARMNYRGSSSLNFDKKSYAFCPGAANCVSDKGRKDYVKTEKQNMLGVGEAVDKDWVLYAAAADPSLIRNRLVFDAYKTMTGQWGVSSCYVEVIVDGEYKGVYVFMDKITNNKKRVNITHADGFIVKFDKTDREDRWGGYNDKLGDEKTFKTSRTDNDDIDTYDTTIDQRFEIEYPEKDDFKTTWNSKVGKIQQLFEDFETALADGDYQTVQKYIDYNSWADWFIINEYTKNVDAYRASCFFVYNGDKIEARPLWDQELSFNNTATTVGDGKGCNNTSGLLIQNAGVYSDDFPAPFWFTGGGTNITGGLLNDPCFVQIVKEKWNEYSAEGGILTEAKLAAKISEYETELGTDAASREANFWKLHSRSSISSGCYTGEEGTGYNNTDVTTSKSTMENWIKNRGNGLTTAINGLTGAAFSIQIVPTMIETTPWEPAHIAVNVTPEGYDYTLEYTDNNLKGVANVIIEESGNEITYRIPRPADWEAGDEDEEGERTDIEYGIRATLSVADGTTQCGSQAAPTSTAKIILQDEENEKCPEQ